MYFNEYLPGGSEGVGGALVVNGNGELVVGTKIKTSSTQVIAHQIPHQIFNNTNIPRARVGYGMVNARNNICNYLN